MNRAVVPEGAPPVVVWLPSEWLPDDEDRPITPRVHGSCGWGPDVVEVPELSWSEVAEGSGPHVVLVGTEGEVRDRAAGTLVTSYRSNYPNAEVLILGPSASGLVIAVAEFSAARRVSRPRRVPPTRLVVIEVKEGEAIPPIANEIARNGRGLGWSILLVIDPDRLAASEYFGSLRWNTTTAVVVEDLVPSAATGAGISRALCGEVWSPSGIAAVLDGAPIEWVRSFEAGASS